MCILETKNRKQGPQKKIWQDRIVREEIVRPTDRPIDRQGCTQRQLLELAARKKQGRRVSRKSVCQGNLSSFQNLQCRWRKSAFSSWGRPGEKNTQKRGFKLFCSFRRFQLLSIFTINLQNIEATKLTQYGQTGFPPHSQPLFAVQLGAKKLIYVVEKNLDGIHTTNIDSSFTRHVYLIKKYASRILCENRIHQQKKLDGFVKKTQEIVIS